MEREEGGPGRREEGKEDELGRKERYEEDGECGQRKEKTRRRERNNHVEG